MGHNSVNYPGGVTILLLCTWSDGGSYLYKVSWKYSERYQSYRADTIFIRKFSKGHNPVKCRWSVGSCSLHIVWWWFIFVPSFMKISLNGIRVMERTWNVNGRTDIIRPVFDGHMFMKRWLRLLILVGIDIPCLWYPCIFWDLTVFAFSKF